MSHEYDSQKWFTKMIHKIMIQKNDYQKNKKKLEK